MADPLSNDVHILKDPAQTFGEVELADRSMNFALRFCLKNWRIRKYKLYSDEKTFFIL